MYLIGTWVLSIFTLYNCKLLLQFFNLMMFYMTKLPNHLISDLLNKGEASGTQSQRPSTNFVLNTIMTGLLSIISSQAGAALAEVPAITNAPTQISQQQQAWQDAIIQQRIEALKNNQPSSPDNQTTLSQPNTQEGSRPSAPSSALPDAQSASANSLTATPSVTKPQQPESCLTVQRIQLHGLEPLSKKVAKQLQKRATDIATDGCISVTEANDLSRSITEAYLQAGYFKVNIIAKSLAKDSQKGEVLWQLQPAKIVDIDNQTDLSTARLFGDIIGQFANIAWLDQAVSNGERLIDGRLLLDIYPVGDDVRIVVSQQGAINSVSGDIEWYRNPDDSYGQHQLTGRIALHNVLGQADLTSLSLQQSLSDSYGYDQDNQRRSASIYTSIPNGRWQWSALLAGSEYDRTTVLPHSVLKQSGDDWQANVRGDYVLSRDQDSITTVYGQMAHQQVRSDILGSQIDAQSPTLSSARVGVSRTQLFQSPMVSIGQNTAPRSSGAWVVDLSAEKAFDWHDNPATKAGLSDDYWRVLLSGYLTHQHAVTDEGYWQFTHELQGQYSEDQLFGVSQQSIDGRYGGVRGLSEASNSASSGLTLRNTMGFEPNRANWPRIGQQHIRWSPYVGVDYGMLRTSENQSEDSKNEYAHSGTLGVKLTGYDDGVASLSKRWDLDISASRARVNYSANRQLEKDQDTEVAAALKVYF